VDLDPHQSENSDLDLHGSENPDLDPLKRSEFPLNRKTGSAGTSRGCGSATLPNTAVASESDLRLF